MRGMPSGGHKALESLVGDWDVTMTLYAAMGTAENPYKVKVRTKREWIANGRFVRDVSEGPDYFRQGTLGYSNIDSRYEWVTQDAMNANMMVYLGEPGSGVQMPINMSGSFTDQGFSVRTLSASPSANGRRSPSLITTITASIFS